MAKILGNNLVVRIGTSVSDPVILCSTSCTLNLNQNTVEASCKGDPATSGDKWTSAIAGSASWDISTDNLYDDDITKESFDKLAQLIINDANGTADNSADVVFEIVGAVAPNITTYTGTVMLTDISLNGPTDEYSTFTANFKGLGILTQTPAV